MDSETPLERAKRVIGDFTIRNDIYLVGSLESRVTVYGQQVRAHNLAWALAADAKVRGEAREVAIIGGGVAGLTTAVGVLSLFEKANVTLFERSLDLCSLQRGCDTRWLHPRIYDWPAAGSRVPSASLPILNWSEGRASDVADQMLRGFARAVNQVERGSERLRVYLGVDYLRVDDSNRSIQWVGREGRLDGLFVVAGPATGDTKQFDRIALALGFGDEMPDPNYPTASYWTNEQLAQARLDGTVRSYLISGYGDGALVDLCRLTIERFRQDRILYDLFGEKLQQTEEQIYQAFKEAKESSLFETLQELERNGLLAKALQELRRRIRKDTRVVLHLRGKEDKSPNAELAAAFGNASSFCNRMMLYLLYRCGAYSPNFNRMSEAVTEHLGPKESVICRYGTDKRKHVASVFVDPTRIQGDLDRIEKAHAQSARREWKPGSIPYHGD